MGDCLQWDRQPRRDDKLRIHICVSRVREADDLLLAQPYCSDKASCPGRT